MASVQICLKSVQNSPKNLTSNCRKEVKHSWQFTLLDVKPKPVTLCMIKPVSL
uniref:Uncharacterized protein n=1 Tax=Anguilla anguilla TaxID=7936 RepID=A0A0E9UHA8_ANGAN